MNPDIYIKVRFKMPLEEGRKTSVKCKDFSKVNFYACPLIINDAAYDGRLLIEDRELELGETYEVPVVFLDKNSVLTHLVIGKKIILWEGKEIATGQVTRIFCV